MPAVLLLSFTFFLGVASAPVPEQVLTKEMSEAFAAWDTDKNNDLSLSEYVAGMKSLRDTRNASSVNGKVEEHHLLAGAAELFKKYADAGGNGTLDKSGFAKVLKDMEVDTEVPEGSFAAWDTNNNTKLNLKELQYGLKDFHASLMEEGEEEGEEEGDEEGDEEEEEKDEQDRVGLIEEENEEKEEEGGEEGDEEGDEEKEDEDHEGLMEEAEKEADVENPSLVEEGEEAAEKEGNEEEEADEDEGGESEDDDFMRVLEEQFEKHAGGKKVLNSADALASIFQEANVAGVAKDDFLGWDADKNGELSLHEFQAGMLFKKHVGEKGSLNQEEFRSLLEEFESEDEDEDDETEDEGKGGELKQA